MDQMFKGPTEQIILCKPTQWLISRTVLHLRRTLFISRRVYVYV